MRARRPNKIAEEKVTPPRRKKPDPLLPHAPPVEHIMPPDETLPPPRETEDEAELHPMTLDYFPRYWPHVQCPKCHAGDPRIYKTRDYGRSTLRYHNCFCGLKFKSIEGW